MDPKNGSVFLHFSEIYATLIADLYPLKLSSMSEQFHSEKPQENSPVTEKAFPPALEEFKTLMGRSVLRTLVPVYEGLSDTKKIALLRSLGENKEKMGQFTQDPTGMRALVEDIVGRLERQEVKKDNQEVKVDI